MEKDYYKILGITDEEKKLQGLQAARHPHLHVRQQARPLRQAADRHHGRDRERARHPLVSDELAYRLRHRLQGRCHGL